MASIRVSLLFLVSAAVLSGSVAQQLNIPVGIQCLNLLDNSQIANIPGLNVGVIQVLASALGGPAQAPSAIFFNSGSSTNNCTNNQQFNSNSTCSSAVGPINLGVLGQGTLIPCFNQPPTTPPNGGRKLLQQINIPVTVQCLNLLDNSQIANIPNLNVGIIQVIASVLGAGGQTPSALFFNSGTSTNNCVNNQQFNSNSTCSSAVGPINLGVLGQGTLIPCYNQPPAGGRKLLQQINVPVTVQCLNLLNNGQILNIPGLNVGVIQLILSALGGAGQAPSALFFNTGTSTNNCVNNQTFNSNSTCSSAIGPINAGVLGQGTLIPCFNQPPAGGRKLLQQVNVPVTAQCVNLLDNSQVANIPNAVVQVIGVIAAVAGGGAQTPSAIFYNTGTSTNNCQNFQTFNTNGTCSSGVGPVNIGALGQGTLITCYPAPPAGGRKLLQQINIPITVQCVNLLNNDQILNIPNLNAGVIQLILSALGGGGQTPSAIFFNSGTSTNNCQNNQEFNSTSNCSSAVGPVNLGVLGQGTLIPCYGN